MSFGESKRETKQSSERIRAFFKAPGLSFRFFFYVAGKSAAYSPILESFLGEKAATATARSRRKCRDEKKPWRRRATQLRDDVLFQSFARLAFVPPLLLRAGRERAQRERRDVTSLHTKLTLCARKSARSTGSSEYLMWRAVSSYACIPLVENAQKSERPAATDGEHRKSSERKHLVLPCSFGAFSRAKNKSK